MKYYICEGTPDGEYNANSKARNDANKILENNGYKAYFIPSKYGVQTNKLLKFKQLIDYKRNYNTWKEYIDKLNRGDIIVIQYPLVNSMILFENMIKHCRDLGIITVILIHDLDSLRVSNMPRKVKEDKEVINNADYVIAHNLKMKQKLVEMGNKEDKIVELEVFDYLYENEVTKKNLRKDDAIIIAGNLSKEKAKYLTYLKEIKNVKFNLYGKGYNKEDGEENINYKGAFLPEKLPVKLEGSFGLVWDGISKNSCEGEFGNYLRYNNPHKFSLYISSKLPVIVWKESALSDFVEKNDIGISVNSLDNIGAEIKKMTDEDYKIKLKNVEKVSKKLRNGYFLSSAINLIEDKITEK